MSIANEAVAVVAAGLFVLAAISDLRSRLIPNALPLGIAAIAVLRLALGGDLAAAGWAALGAAAVFAAGALCFARGYLGGGDVKLASAAALFLGAAWLPIFLFAMSLAGLALSLTVLAKRRLQPATSAGGAAAVRGATQVPYGVAIAVAAIWILSKQFIAG